MIWWTSYVDSEFQKIKNYRKKFDEDLLKKGEDIINGIERECIYGFEVSYESEYDDIFTKNKQEE